MIGKTISHYRIIEKLGEGGMGVVYKAEDTRLKRPVALKFLAPELTRNMDIKERFVKEAQAASALEHTNICTIHEIDETEDGQMFICMAYYEGETLQKKIRSESLKLDEALSIAMQIAQGLARAHEKGIIHRDIKSANILVTKRGEVKILDFGLAKLAGQTLLTRTGTVMGTVAYMSPEQTRGAAVDHRTDIWSFGVILYEMMTKQLPFKGDHEQAVMYSVLKEDPHPITRIKSELPEDLEKTVNKALAKSPDDRYQNIEELLAGLRSIKEKLKSKTLQEKASKTKAIPSIAVLPFRDMSPQKDQEYFCEGMAEELINALVKVEDLKVAARTSAFQFKEVDQDIRKIGKKLEVDTILEGSVRKAESRLRITAQLINVADGYHLWSEKYDRDMADIFAIQDDISIAIVDKLKGKLLRDEKERLVKRFTEDQDAYNLYLEGRYLWNRRYRGGLQKGIECFQQAIDKDPHYALAYAGIADCYNLLGLYTWLPPKKAFPKAKRAAKKALEIEDTLSEAHASMGWIHTYYDWDWPAAEREFKRAIELNPKNATAHQWYALYLGQMGRFDESIVEAERAQKLDPLSLIINGVLGLCFHISRQYDKAIEQYNKTLEMDPNFPMQYLFQGWTYTAKEMWQEAIKALKRHEVLSQGSPFAVGTLGAVYARAGKKDEAQKKLDQLDDLSKEKYVSPYYRAIILEGLGQKDQFFTYLEKAYLEREGFMASLKTAEWFDSVRSDLRFKTLLKKMNLD